MRNSRNKYDRELINVIKTLFHLQTQIKLIINTINATHQNNYLLDKISLSGYFSDKISFRDSLNATLSNYSIILFCSFLDEYNKHFVASGFNNEFTDRIIYVRKQNKPGIKKINKWKDLFDFRNQLVAHNFDIKGESFFSNDITKLEYKIPNTISEKELFSGITHLICTNIRDEFIDIVSKLNPNEIMLDKINIISEVVDTDKELNILLKLMR